MANSKLQIWSNAVRERDGKCLKCGKTEDLHAHHIKPKATHPELILDVKNGKTLCYSCHKSEHEQNRPVRIRSQRPRRKTLEKKIQELEKIIEDLEKQYKYLESKNKKLKNIATICEKGTCKSGLMLSRINNPFWNTKPQ
jgi:predicted nucleic-acid-binding Zn-ribbon protein